MVDVAGDVDPAVFIFAGSVGFSAVFMIVAAVNGAIHGHGLHLHSADPGHAGAGGHAPHGTHVPQAPDAGHAPYSGHVGHVQHSMGHAQHGHAGHAHLGKPVHHAPTAPTADAQVSAAHDGGMHDGQLHQQAGHDAHAADRAAQHYGHFTSAPGYAHADTSSRLQGYWHGLTSLALRSLNLYALLTFLFFFGLTGLLLLRSSLQHNKPLLFTIATMIGVAAALLVTALLNRLFGDTSGLVTQENSHLRGRMAKITHRIRDGGTGEIVYIPRGGVPQNYPARSADGKAIALGRSVVVVDFKGGIALVELLDLAYDLDGGDDGGARS